MKSKYDCELKQETTHAAALSSKASQVPVHL